MSSSRSNAQDLDDDKTDQQNDSANTASSTGVDPLMTLLMQNLASSGTVIHAFQDNVPRCCPVIITHRDG